MDDARRLFDGYDTGIRYADEHAGKLVAALGSLGVLDETAIVVTSDHGENQGELNVYADHHTADGITSRVPFLLSWPGLAPRVDPGFHYQVDLAATVVELAGGKVPESWDGRSVAASLKRGTPVSRDAVVVSQLAWTCQRSARWEDWMYLRTYHDGYHGWPAEMLFNLREDPHEQDDLAPKRSEIVAKGRQILSAWREDAMRRGRRDIDGRDPLDTVMGEGGPYHTRGELAKYCERLRATGRGEWAEKLLAAHPGEP